MNPNSLAHAATLELALEPVPADQSIEGAPATGALTLTELGGPEVGVWEMTPGVITDVEADEVFLVLSGSASVEFADDGPPLQLGAGDVVRLEVGARTTWTVTETLRKVYLT